MILIDDDRAWYSQIGLSGIHFSKIRENVAQAFSFLIKSLIDCRRMRFIRATFRSFRVMN